MKPKKCPKCGAEITRYWKNPIADQIVGRCPTCGKLVNLGRANQSTDSPTGTEPAKKGQGKEKSAPPAKVKRGRSVKAAPAAARTGARPAPPAPTPAAPGKQRTGIRKHLAEFFEID